MKDASYFGQGRMMVHTAYPEDERKKKGLLGRDFALGVGGLSVQNMCQTLINGMDGAFENWKHRKKYELFKIK